MSNQTGIEPNSELYQNLSSSFFNKLPVDGTRNNTKWVKILPQSGVTDDTKEFKFEFTNYDLPHVWDISRTLVSVRLQIVKQGTTELPNKDST